MLPGRVYKPEDFLVIASRYRRLILIPTIVVTILAVGISRVLPNKYRSETLVMVVPQRVPETYVRSTVTTKIEDRVRSIREQILSRSRLERIISEFDLYAEERQKRPMEDIIDDMRQNVGTHIVRQDAFSVSFIADRPELAQKVTERLAGMFSDENMRDREKQAESTNEFLRTQLEEARQRLTEHEHKVEDFRRRYSGELPDQVTANLQAIQNAELQIQTLTQSLNSDRAQRLLIERQLADANSPDLPVAAGPAGNVVNPTPSTAQQLETAEANLRTLETQLMPQHPDLVAARAAVKRLERMVAQDRAATAAGQESPRLAASEVVRRNRINDLKAQLEMMDRQVAQKSSEEARLRAVIASYRSRVEAAPARQTQLVALTRDYETLQRQYRTLLENFEDSKVAANLERRQIGEQFRILDPARVPERPFTPNRLLISGGGLFGGLLLGLLLAAAMEFKDRTLRTADDVALCVSLPVLVAVPTVTTALDRLRARRQRLIGWSVTATLGIGILAAILVAWRMAV